MCVCPDNATRCASSPASRCSTSSAADSSRGRSPRAPNRPARLRSLTPTSENRTSRYNSATRASAQQPSVGEPLLQVTELDCSYGSLQVLFGVSIEVAEAGRVALLGTNGAGKSTLLRAV